MTYEWRFKPIRFNGLPLPKTPDRKIISGKEVKDGFDFTFENKEAFDQWYKERTIGLAELDEAMNFCEYFVREKGNKGHYVRGAKSFPVDGSWTEIQDFDDHAKPFAQWLEQNCWRNDWFLLKEKYRKEIVDK